MSQLERTQKKIVNVGSLDRTYYYFFRVATQLSSRGWDNPVPHPLLLRIFGSAENRTRHLWICGHKLWPLDHRGCRSFNYYTSTTSSLPLWSRAQRGIDSYAGCSFLQVTSRLQLGQTDRQTDRVGLKHFHERGNTEDHWSGTLVETFVLTLTDFQSISVEAATCLLAMVHWMQPHGWVCTPRGTGQTRAISRQCTQTCQLASLLAEPLNLYIIQLRATVCGQAFRRSTTHILCFRYQTLGCTWQITLHCL
jgi:hypothetical protein